MSVDPLAFLDEPSAETESTSDPLSFLDQSTSPLRKPARYAAQAGKGALNLIPGVAAYNLATTLVREGAHRSRTRVSAQAQKDLQRMNDKVARGEPLTRLEKIHYDRTKQLAERKSEKAADISTEGLINKAVKASTGIDLEPEDLGEEITNIGASLISPSKAIRNVQKIPKLFSAEGRAALSAERAAAKTKAGWDSLTKATKGSPEKQGIVNWAQQNGLTPREATILLQSEKKVGLLGRASKKTKQFQRDVEGLKEKLGSKYEELKQIGRQGGYLSSKQVMPLIDDLNALRDNIGKTLIEGPDTKAALKSIEEAIFKLEHEGATLEHLIASRQNVGQQVNWNAVDPKGAMLGKAKDAFMKSIEKINPNVAKELRATDKAYAQYKKFENILDKKQAFVNVKGIPVPTGNIAFGLGLKLITGMNPATAAKYALIKEGVQRFSTAMLTNPKLQGIHKKLVQATLHGDTEQQRKLMVAAQKILKKDDPELYNELGLD